MQTAYFVNQFTLGIVSDTTTMHAKLSASVLLVSGFASVALGQTLSSEDLAHLAAKHLETDTRAYRCREMSHSELPSAVKTHDAALELFKSQGDRAFFCNPRIKTSTATIGVRDGKIGPALIVFVSAHGVVRDRYWSSD